LSTRNEPINALRSITKPVKLTGEQGITAAIVAIVAIVAIEPSPRDDGRATNDPPR
jgi:hypothetical protein